MPLLEVWVEPESAFATIASHIARAEAQGPGDHVFDAAEYRDHTLEYTTVGGQPAVLETAKLSGTFGHFQRVPTVRLIFRPRSSRWARVLHAEQPPEGQAPLWSPWIVVEAHGPESGQLVPLRRLLATVQETYR
jgi:hypothetical protein